ncbi:MAG: hypothetical protein J1F38_00655 [Muribaculaceae bacterium]|nr:hypothetical protein [Muribaculaceae bacterium]
MAKHFVNTNPNVDSPSATGWDSALRYDKNRIPKIEDTIQGGLALHKMGTSIPHPFARLFVFETAFNEVNKTGHGVTNTSYAKLVSECLDLLEFLYQYGDQVTIRKWDRNDISKLHQSQSLGHHKLAASLEKAINNLSYPYNNSAVPVGSIFLFYYKGALLGGTSPLSLVFTSPNIRRNLKSINANGFVGLNGNNLFQDYSSATAQAVPLNERAQEFQDFLFRFYFAYQNLLKDTAIGSYIGLNGPTNNPVVWNNFMAQSPAQHQAQFGPNGQYNVFTLQVNGNTTQMNILSGANVPNVNLHIPLGFRNPAAVNVIQGNNPAAATSAAGTTGRNMVVSSDYEIRPEFSFPEDHILPLVLNNAGIPGALLVNGRPIPENLVIAESIENENDRLLPTGQNIRYPYLYADDFLEDSLVELPYKINSDNFISLSCQGKYFLLPVKPKFFKYFKPESLKNWISIEKDGDSYKVKLNIPIKYQQGMIELAKPIKRENILNLNDGAHMPGLAIFPSYRITNDEALNQYQILLREEETHPDIVIYKKDEQVSFSKRVNRDSNFYKVDSAFDAIVVQFGSFRGTVIPQFFNVETKVDSNLTVGVDFGTTNTYLCIQSSSNGSIDTLELDKARPQVLTLNAPDLTEGNKSQAYKDSMAPFGVDDFFNVFSRQFVPHQIGKDASASFPFRTIAFEDETFQHNHHEAMLFSDISIGFNNLNEAVQIGGYKYVSNLKWLLSQSSHANVAANEKRIELFIFELAWLIKNAIMLGPNPTKTPTVYTTYPSAMKRSERNKIDSFWKKSFNTLMGEGNVNIINSIYEATAPFLYLHKDQPAVGSNSVNIDIGGGTTDILYIDAEGTHKMYTDSVKFAGDDLWGDGIPTGVKNLRNPYFLTIENLVGNNTIKVDAAEAKRFAQQKDLADTSSDIMSYIFRNKAIYGPEMHFPISPALKQGLYAHFAAIIYNVGRTIKALGMKADNLKVTFSGLGSKYIELISQNNDDIAEIIKAIFNDLGINAPNLSVVTHPSPKEITAMGAIMASKPNVHNSLKAFTGDNLKPKEIILDDNSIKDKEEEAPTKAEIINRHENGYKEYEEFVNKMLKNPAGKFNTLLRRDFEVKFDEKFCNALLDKPTITAAYQACAALSAKEDADRISETTFFWPLKQTLIAAASV